jgi:hypothetical protein
MSEQYLTTCTIEVSNDLREGGSEGKKISSLIGEVIMLNCNDVMTT